MSHLRGDTLVADVDDKKCWRQFCHQHDCGFIEFENLEVFEVRHFLFSTFRFFSANSLFLYFVLLYFRPIYQSFHEAFRGYCWCEESDCTPDNLVQTLCTVLFISPTTNSFFPESRIDLFFLEE